MKKLPKSQKKIQKRYWINPGVYKDFSKYCKEIGAYESRIIQDLIKKWQYDNPSFPQI